ncbi:ImmA/IrrE family metallo-endopeptidase [Lactobacillus rossiae]|uniref:ImmA/IrrE family metallo-endopeptidase n=2 Tax=Furfurilactobacillus milii TaxID=2888272 RepID=A0A6N9I0A7_9LACO|nr:ImmA/IrrE family metallo-endopeptidase [Furfurilactobacillus milii]
MKVKKSPKKTLSLLSEFCEAKTMSNQTVLEYLNRLAADNQIKIFWLNQLHEFTTPACDTQTRKIVMNPNWHNANQIPFQLAHEIAHVLISDNSDRILYFSSAANHSKIEMEANKKAVELLIPEYLEYADPANINANDFVDQFSVPHFLSNFAQEVLSNCSHS